MITHDTPIIKQVNQALNRITYQLSILKYRPKLWWNRLWIRRDEFHPTLDMNHDILVALNKEDRVSYIKDIVRRNRLVHQRDIERKDKEHERKKRSNSI